MRRNPSVRTLLRAPHPHDSLSGARTAGILFRPKPLWAMLLTAGLSGGALPAAAQPCAPGAAAMCSAQGGTSTSDRPGAGGAGNGQGGGAQMWNDGLVPVPGAESLNGVGGKGADGDAGLGGLGGAGGPLGARGGDGDASNRMPGGGGGGGAGFYIPGTGPANINLIGGFTGGAGGTGGASVPGSGAGGGGGGGGGAALVSESNDLTLSVRPGVFLMGGAGGAGGSDTTSAFAYGGGGGGGGDGVLLFGANAHVSNEGTITGGAGGMGGRASMLNGGDGESGAGIRALGSGLWLENAGTINGGAAGAGQAGAAVIARGNATIVNNGTLAGGLGSSGQAPSVIFYGANNRLTLGSASSVRGALSLANGASASVFADHASTLDGVVLDNNAQLSLETVGATLDLGAMTSGAGFVQSTGTGTLRLRGVSLTGSIVLANSGGVELESAISTTGPQTYSGPVQLLGNVALGSTAGAIHVSGTLDGAHTLRLEASNGVTLDGAVGRNTPLTSLSIASDVAQLSNDIYTQQTQSYGAVQLAGPASLRSMSGDIGFTGAVDGAQQLAILTPAAVSFAQPVGDATPLTGLAVNAGTLSIGRTQVTGGVSLSTTQSLTQSGAFDIMGNSAFTSLADVTLVNTGNRYGGTVQATGRNITLAAGGSLSLGPLTATQAVTVIQSGSGGVMLSGDITAPASLSFLAAGTVAQTAGQINTGTLSGSMAGDLTLASAGNAISGIGNLDARTISLASSLPLSISGSLRANELWLDAPQGASVTGSVEAAAFARIAAGTTLTVGGGATAGTLDADTVVQGTLVFNRSDSVAFDGALGGAGQLVQRGAGKLLFDGDGSAFQGSTFVSSGELVVGSAADSGAKLKGNVQVAGGAALAGHGRILGSATLASGAVLSPGNSIGTLTVDGDFSMASGTRMEAELGAAGIGDKVAVGGNLALNGVTLDISDAGGMGPGIYNLFSYGGALSESNGGLILGAAPAGHTLQLQTLTTDKRINIADTSNVTLHYWNADRLANATRSGGGSGVWSTTSPFWTNADGSVTAAMTPQPGFAVFGGASGRVAVDNTAGAVRATGLQFLSDGYRLTGDPLELVSTGGPVYVRVGDGSQSSAGYTAVIDATLAGTHGLVKADAGTLALEGVNTYTGDTLVQGGALQVSDERNLGAAGNGVALQGGSLRIAGQSYASTDRRLSLQPGGAIDVAEASHVFAWNGGISGAGALEKRGAGTLVLTAANTYAGGTTVSGGTLQVGDGGTRGSIAGDAAIAAGATLAFNRSDTQVYAGALSGGGALRKMGSGTLVLTGDNAFAGATTIDDGTLRIGDGAHAGRLSGDIVDHGRLVFDRADDTAFGGAISGAGELTKAGAGTLVLSGDGSGFTGSARVQAGTLQVDGKLGGTLVVESGTTLSGTGTAGATALAAGATLSPGNAATAFATLGVAGDLAFGPGATYRVDIDADGRHDSVRASGAATLSGSVVALGANGNYQASTSYTILQADGGVRGVFDAVSSNLAFLTPSLVYGGNTVDLRMQRKQDPGGGQPLQFADLARTDNQRNTADALQSLPTGNALYTRVLNLPSGAPPAAFDALSGEVHASATGMLQRAGDTVARLPLSRLRGSLDAGWLPGAPTARAGAGDASALPRPAAQPVWAQVFGNWRTAAGGDGMAEISQSDGGVFVGGDHGLGDGWRLGGALGYASGHASLDARASRADADSYSAVLYGGKAFEAGRGKLNVMAGAAYTWHDIDTERGVDAAGAAQTLKASYGADTRQLFSEIGYALPLGERVVLEPFAGAAYSELRTRAFSESGGDAALSGARSRNAITASTLGLRASAGFQSGAAHGRLRGLLGWRHAFGDVNPHASLSFEGSQPFTVAGAPLARDAALVEIGIDALVSRSATIGVSYGGQFGGGNRQNTGTVDVRWRF